MQEKMSFLELAKLYYDKASPKVLPVGKSLLNFRLCFYGISLLIASTSALTLGGINYDLYEDETITQYKYLRFRLITVLVMITHIVYMSLSLFLDWQEKNDKHVNSKLHQNLSQFRHFLITTILLPLTCYMDIFFWRTWAIDRELLVPLACDVIIPLWCQHILHTYSLFFIFVEILAVPRIRPKEFYYPLACMLIFWVSYIFVVVGTWLESGLWAYPFLAKFTWPERGLYCLIYSPIELSFYIFLQWTIVDVARDNKIKML